MLPKMSLSYSIEEDVTLLQAVLQVGAHLRVKTEEEINPITHCISRHIMNEVVEMYRTIKRERGYKFPARTNKGLSHRFRNILYRYGVGRLAETGTKEASLLRIRLLNKVVREREKHNDRKRQRSVEVKIEPREQELNRSVEDPPRKRLCSSLGNLNIQKRPEEAGDPCSDKSLSEDVVPDNKTKEQVCTKAEVKVKKESELAQEAVVNSISEEKTQCLQFIIKLLDKGEERRSRTEERNLAMEEMLLGTKQAENNNDTHSNEDFRDRQLRLEYMKTILARRELELREKELEMRQKEKMWSLMEKMLG